MENKKTTKGKCSFKPVGCASLPIIPVADIIMDVLGILLEKKYYSICVW